MHPVLTGLEVPQTPAGPINEHLPLRFATQDYENRTFIDLFAGAGCLSLGLMTAGWKGLLAVEKDPMAFQTLHDNLVDGQHGYVYSWPDWFPKEPCSVSRFARKYGSQLRQLRGQVTLIAGGPPCQGFSFAGRRDKFDYRNSLFRSYMQVVETVQPLFILLENVHGITIEFGKEKRLQRATKVGRPPVPYSQRIAKAIESAGYYVYPGLVRAVDFGVPQFRPRYFLLAVLRSAVPSKEWCDPFKELHELKKHFLRWKGLPIERSIAVKEALSDLETSNGRTTSCADSPGFEQGIYSSPQTHYQRMMRELTDDCLPDSHRLVNHRSATVARFQEILDTCRRGVQLNKENKAHFGLKKNCIVPLDPNQPSHTLTTLPDDLIHYSEPRILTVREYARLQSIPDWFKFRGKYTTGGDQRVRECPRYTQAGNALPPLLGEAIGILLARLYIRLVRARRTTQTEAVRDVLLVGGT